jgi:hypothetical protein
MYSFLFLCLFKSDTSINLLVGIIGSIVASIIFTITNDKLRSRKEKIRYGKIEGLFKGEGNTSADVHYMGKNQLEISVTEGNGDIWLGFISLYNQKNGTIDWNYLQPDEKVARFGLKKIIITNADNFKLIGEKEKGYGIEIFTRHQFIKK